MFSSHQRASTHQFQWNKFLKCQCFCFERSYYLFVAVWRSIKITSFWRYSVQEMLSYHLNLTIWARCKSFDWFALPVLSSSSKEKCSHWLKMLTKQPFTDDSDDFFYCIYFEVAILWLSTFLRYFSSIWSCQSLAANCAKSSKLVMWAKCFFMMNTLILTSFGNASSSTLLSFPSFLLFFFSFNALSVSWFLQPTYNPLCLKMQIFLLSFKTTQSNYDLFKLYYELFHIWLQIFILHMEAPYEKHRNNWQQMNIEISFFHKERAKRRLQNFFFINDVQ